MEIIALTFDVGGKIMVAYTAILVHFRVWKEHQIDQVVFKEMRREQVVSIAGIIFILIGYVIEVFVLIK